MPHIVLLGDSIFDNAPYTSGGPDVITQLRGILPSGWTATLEAVDGSTMDDLGRQIPRIPADATHLVLSIGGNDALAQSGILGQSAQSTAQVLGLLAELSHQFEQRYRQGVDAVLRRGLPTILCTIYNGNFPDPLYQRLASTALTIFNDAILRVAFERGLPVIDLRLICAAPEDYANSIEPSSAGGAKIARAIVHALGLARNGGRKSTVVAT